MLLFYLCCCLCAHANMRYALLPVCMLKDTSSTFIHSEESTQVRVQGDILTQIPLIYARIPSLLSHSHAITLFLPFSHSLPPTLLHFSSSSSPASLPHTPPSVVLGRRYKGLYLFLASHRGSPWSGESSGTVCASYKLLVVAMKWICFCVYAFVQA